MQSQARKANLVHFMMYPGEFHYFARDHVLRDAWRRVDEFFRKNLMESRPASTNFYERFVNLTVVGIPRHAPALCARNTSPSCRLETPNRR